MCNRFSQVAVPDRWVRRFSVSDLKDLFRTFRPNPNVAPLEPAYVILEEDGRRVADRMIFGLVPRWSKDAKIATSCLNARSETIAERGAFRDSFAARRCAVPVDGYYEWKTEGKVKFPYRFEETSGEPFGLAAVWDEWKDPTGALRRTFAIVTTEANALARSIHDRMPVLLSRENEGAWLKAGPLDDAERAAILRPAPAEALKRFPVSRRLNDVREKDPGLIAPVADQPDLFGG